MTTTTTWPPCCIDGCDKECNTHKGGGHGMCSMHYGRWRRGRLDKPRYQRPRGALGMTTKFPFEVQKVGGVWYRRPTGSNEEWKEVQWSESSSSRCSS